MSPAWSTSRPDRRLQRSTERDVLGERHRVPLDVALARARRRRPRRGAVLLARPSTGRASTAPTRIGTPIASTAASITRRASALTKGSMSLAFSGQITRSGCGTLPARDGRPRGRCVASRGCRATARALGVELQARPRHVALNGRDRHAAAAPGASGSASGQAAEQHGQRQRPQRPAAVADWRSAQGDSTAASSSAPARRHGEGHQRRAAERGQAEGGRIGLREREPAPREAAEGDAAAERLHRDPEPPCRRPQDQPAAQADLQPLDEAERRPERAEQRLAAGPARSRQPTDDDARPREQRQRRRRGRRASRASAAQRAPRPSRRPGPARATAEWRAATSHDGARESARRGHRAARQQRPLPAASGGRAGRRRGTAARLVRRSTSSGTWTARRGGRSVLTGQCARARACSMTQPWSAGRRPGRPSDRPRSNWLHCHGTLSTGAHGPDLDPPSDVPIAVRGDGQIDLRGRGTGRGVYAPLSGRRESPYSDSSCGGRAEVYETYSP